MTDKQKTGDKASPECRTRIMEDGSLYCTHHGVHAVNGYELREKCLQKEKRGSLMDDIVAVTLGLACLWWLIIFLWGAFG